MLEDRIESWYKRYGRKIVIAILVLVSIYIILRLNIIGLFAPFILAWLFASLLNPVVSWLNKNLKIPRGIGTILSMISILSGLLGIISVLVRKLWEQVVNFAGSLPAQTDEIMYQLSQLEERFGGTIEFFPGSNHLLSIDALIEQILDKLSSFFSVLIPHIYDVIAKVPDIVLFTIMMLLATFFMTKDYGKIKSFVKAQLSDTVVNRMVLMQRGVIVAIGGYVRTQVIMMSFTFIICLIGLFVFGVEYALLLSVIIAFVDALPVFGSGTILIPWGIYSALTGDLALAVGLLGIYGIIFITRQILEPKILSTQIGVYALVTVMAVYIGYRTMGVFGMILGPVIVVTVQVLQNVGALPQFKPVEPERHDIVSKKGEPLEK